MKMKHEQTKLSMVTAYDFPSAKQAQQADIDMILVGDSLGMTVLGYESTVQVTIEDMIHHGKAVRRGAPDTFVVVDMPIGTVGLSDEDDLKHALRLYQETQANALKWKAHILFLSFKGDTYGYSNRFSFRTNSSKCRGDGLQITRWHERSSYSVN